MISIVHSLQDDKILRIPLQFLGQSQEEFNLLFLNFAGIRRVSVALYAEDLYA
jgi:hypothetical protein